MDAIGVVLIVIAAGYLFFGPPVALWWRDRRDRRAFDHFIDDVRRAHGQR